MASMVWLDAHGCSDEPATITARLHEALRAPAAPLAAERRADALALLAPVLRERLRDAQRAAWRPAQGREGVARLLGRLWELARGAARDRRQAELDRLQRAIRFVGGGHTAGEATLVSELARADARSLARALPHLPAPGDDGVPAARLVGVLVFGPLPSRARAATFARHDALSHDPLRSRRDPDRLDPAHPEQLSPHPGPARHPRAER
jgi:hypothetical protein